MLALGAAIRCFCKLTNCPIRRVRGGRRSIENRRGTRSPPISKLSISPRRGICPCPIGMTCHFLLRFAGSCLTCSISADRSSTLMPLTTVGSTVLFGTTMMGRLFGNGAPMAQEVRRWPLAKARSQYGGRLRLRCTNSCTATYVRQAVRCHARTCRFCPDLVNAWNDVPYNPFMRRPSTTNLRSISFIRWLARENAGYE
jgi:hypothetical protein